MGRYLIKNIIKGEKEFKPVIDLTRDLDNLEWKDKLIPYYIVTEEVTDIFKEILETIVQWKCVIENGKITHRDLPPSAMAMHRITGSYATGKSYLLLFISHLLSCEDKRALLKKFAESKEICEMISRIGDKRFFPVRIDAAEKGDMPFNIMIARSLQEALGKSDLKGGRLPLEYDKAIDHIKKILANKSLCEGFMMNLNGLSIEDLKRDLQSDDREALDRYFEICERTFGRSIERFSVGLEELVVSACNYVRESGYSGGLIFYVDEMTQYLDYSFQNNRISGDMCEIQSLSKICSARNKIWFIMAEHQELPTFLERKREVDTFKKVIDRFQAHSLAVFHREKYVKGIVEADPTLFRLAMRTGNAKFDDIKALANDYGWDFLDYYPFHPTTIRLLFWVSDELGRKERTSFQFIQKKFLEVKEQPAVIKGRLNLVNPDTIFEYFLDQLQGVEFQELRESYGKILRLCKSEVDKRVVNVLTSLYVAALAPNTEAKIASSCKPEEMALYLNTDDVGLISEILERLYRESSNIDRDAGGYYFAIEEVSSFDLNEIKQKASEVDAIHALEEAIARKKDEWNLCISRSYVSETLGIRKDFRSEIQPVELLEVFVNRLKTEDEAGRVIFLVSAKSDTYGFDGVLDLAKEIAAANVIIAVPRVVSMISYEGISNWEAVQILMEKYTEDKKQQGLKKVQGQMKDDIENSLKRFGSADNFVFVTGLGLFESKSKDKMVSEEQKIVKDVLDPFVKEYFSEFPEIGEVINDRTPTNRLIGLIIAPRINRIPKSGKDFAYVTGILERLGLVELKEEENYLEVTLREPDHQTPKSRRIWDIISENLDSISEIYSRLQEPPIGLSNELIELFLATYVGNKKARICDKSGILDLDKKVIGEITRKKDDYYQLEKMRSLSEDEKDYIYSLWLEIDKLVDTGNYARFSSSKSYHEKETWDILRKDLRDLDNMTRETNETISSLAQHISLITKKNFKFNEIVTLGKMREVLAESNNNNEPMTGCESLERIADILEEKELEGFGSRISFLRKFFSFLQNHLVFRNLSLYMRKIIEIPFREDPSYSEISSKFMDLAGFLDKMGNKLLIDETTQNDTRTKAQELWNTYVYHYSEEHSQANQTKDKLKKSVLESKWFILLDELSKILFPELVRSDNIRTDLFAIVPRMKDEFNPAEEMAFLFDLRRESNLGLPGIICPNCTYRLGEIKTFKIDLEDKEKIFAETVQNAISEHFNELMNISRDFLWYLSKDFPEKREELTNFFSELTNFITKYQKAILNDDEIQQVVCLVKILRDPINEFLSKQSKESTEQKTVTFSKFISEIRARIGRKEITIDRFEEKIMEWIEETRRKFGEEAMIQFGSRK